MGISSAIAVADSHLTTGHLAALGLVPDGGNLVGETVLTTSSERRALVVRRDGFTVVLDGGDALTEVLDEGELDLPGTVHVGCAASSAGFAEYRAERDGRTIRRLVSDEDEVTVDEGDPVIDESRFFFDSEDEELGRELDGDLLVQLLPRLAGLDIDVFSLEGEAYRGEVAPDSDDAVRDTAAPDDQPPSGPARKKGFLGTIFGR